MEKKLLAISIRYSAESSSITGLLFVHKRGVVRFEPFECDSLRSIPKKLKRFPIVVSVTGDKLLVRNIEATQNEGGIDFRQFLPGFNVDNCLIEEAGEGENRVIAVIRKDLLNETINECQKLGLNIQCMNLGLTAVIDLARELNLNEIHFNGKSIDLSGSEVRCTSSNRVQGPLKIESQQLDERYVIPFASATLFTLNGHNPGSELLKDNKVNRRYKVLTIRCLMAGIAVNALTMGSTRFLDLRTNQAARINEVDRVKKEQTRQEVDSLKKQFTDLQQLLQNMMPGISISFTQMIAMIGNRTPEDVYVESIEVLPVISSDILSGRKEFDDQRIAIAGTCLSMNQISTWLNQLDALDFCESARLDSFFPDQQSDKHRFNISITLR